MAENIVMEMVMKPKMGIMNYLLVLRSKQGLVHPLFPSPVMMSLAKIKERYLLIDKFNTCCQNSIN